MEQAQQILFGPFRLDPFHERLWRGEQEVALRAKSLAVLRYLVEHPRRVVTKEELLKTVWAGTYVTQTVLRVCIREIRAALGEEVAAPRYIATVGRLGYQFLGEGRAEETDTEVHAERMAARRIVGRSRESAQVQRWLMQAGRGVRRIGFVTGEPGIGKTALVDLFVDRVRTTGQVRVGRGQCVEQYGEGEAYLQVLEAFGQLCRAPGGQQVLDVLSRYAPTWLVQMPALVNEAELVALQRKVQGATRERMLREMAEAIETLTANRPLVLIFEDLHWSDYSTLELLAYLARRREHARLLVIGTYRPTEVIMSGHPLKGVTQELQAHGHCEELRLELLTESDVADYVTERFAGEAHGQRTSQAEAAPFQQLAQVIYRRTNGNALFMVNLIEHLVRQGLIVEHEGHWQLRGNVETMEEDVPESLRQLIARQIERLSEEEQRVLEVASVAGTDFAAAAVVAGGKQGTEAVEEVCEELAWQGHFLQEGGIEEWPDGTVSGRYQFRHVLYQNVLYGRMAEARRVRLHRQIGEREERAYGTRAREIAAELAVHFERGREYQRAVQYLRQAAENAIGRSAHQEAVSLLTKGLELLKSLPDTPERTQQELTMQITLSAPLIASEGYGPPELERACIRALELCRQVGETPQLFPALLGLIAYYLVRAEIQTVRELVERYFSLAQRLGDPTHLVWSHYLLGLTLFYLSELALAQDHMEQSFALYDPRRDSPLVSGAVQDPKTSGLGYMAWILGMRGYPDQALQRIREALRLAQELAHPLSLAFTQGMAALHYQFRQEWQATQEQVEETMTLCTEQGFVHLLAEGNIFWGWARAAQGQGEAGITQLRQGLAAYRAIGAELDWSHYLALLAEAQGKAGQAEEGLEAVSEALTHVDKTGVHVHEAELYRLKGELTLQSKVQAPKPALSLVEGSRVEQEAEGCFLKAIEIARRQSAKSLELRAVMSLSRLWQQQGKKRQARRMLAEIYGWFTEGFDSADLQEAKALLEELGGKETAVSN